jgi:uncharacterized protein (TIGR00369 family)
MKETHIPRQFAHMREAEAVKAVNHCFGCSPSNPQGLRLRFSLDADPRHLTATSTVNLTELHEGPRGYIHGGIIATLLDEAMSKLNLLVDAVAMTRHMEVDYIRPCPLYTPLMLVGTHVRRDGRKIFHKAELKDSEGGVLARAKGFFLAIDPNYR